MLCFFIVFWRDQIVVLWVLKLGILPDKACLDPIVLIITSNVICGEEYWCNGRVVFVHLMDNMQLQFLMFCAREAWLL